jgi:hypothetical protein
MLERLSFCASSWLDQVQYQLHVFIAAKVLPVVILLTMYIARSRWYVGTAGQDDRTLPKSFCANSWLDQVQNQLSVPIDCAPHNVHCKEQVVCWNDWTG